MNKDGWSRFSIGGKWAYNVSDLGYKYNMTDISASFGIEQLKYVHNWHKRRLEIVKSYIKNLSFIEGFILPKHLCGDVHAWHLFVLRVIPDMWKISRDELINKINDHGIGTSVHYIPIHLHSYYAEKYNYKSSDFPVAKELFNSVITLPLYPSLQKKHVEYVVSVITDLWYSYRL